MEQKIPRDAYCKAYDPHPLKSIPIWGRALRQTGELTKGEPVRSHGVESKRMCRKVRDRDHAFRKVRRSTPWPGRLTNPSSGGTEDQLVPVTLIIRHSTFNYIQL